MRWWASPASGSRCWWRRWWWAASARLFERLCLRRVHAFGHVPELLITFGLTYVILELVNLIWGRSTVAFDPPAFLQGPAFTLIQSPGEGLRAVLGAAPDALCRSAGVACSRFPLTRSFMMAVALAMLVGCGCC